MRIVFMGTPEPAAVSLKRLIADGHLVEAVYTQPDRPSGRGQRIIASPVKEMALANGLPIVQPEKIRTPEALETFRSFNADVAVVVAYGRILPESWLDAPALGAVNVHFSLLPKYRGAAPVNWAIVNGEEETGVTTMRMDRGLDTGPILLQRSTLIGPKETAPELMARLAEMGADVLAETLRGIESIQQISQSDELATFAPIMTRQDGLTDWSRSAVEIERRIRGFQPFPGSYTFVNGERLVLWEASATDSSTSNVAPGEVLQAAGDLLSVACGRDSVLTIAEVQPQGKRRMSVHDFLNGMKVRPGMILGI